jgi:hypothetical protein
MVRLLRFVSLVVVAFGLVAPSAAPASAASGLRVLPIRPPGYVLAAADGGVFALGRGFHGSAAGLHLRAPITGVASTPDGDGYWLVASDGGVFAFGSARFFGSMGGIALNAPIVGIAATPGGAGYWLTASDGGVFAFGDARYFGSLSGLHILAPVVGIATNGDGNGYWLLTAGGEAFALGDALAPGAPPALQAPLLRQYVGIALIPRTTRGIAIATFDGTTLTYDADTAGCRPISAIGVTLNAPVVGVASGTADCGQWLAASDGGVFTLRGAPFLGSAAVLKLAAPIVGIAN